MQAWGPEGFASLDFARKHLTLVQPSPALCQHRSGQRPFDAATLATLKPDLFGRHLEVTEVNGPTCDQLTSELMDFVRCVRSGERPRVAGEEGCAALALATQIVDSIAAHPWDGAAGTRFGPNAFAMPPAPLFPVAERSVAA